LFITKRSGGGGGEKRKGQKTVLKERKSYNKKEGSSPIIKKGEGLFCQLKKRPNGCPKKVTAKKSNSHGSWVVLDLLKGSEGESMH